MLSETLSKGLQQYRIRREAPILRLRKKMGLVELGQHSGLSAAMLSKIERGRLVPNPADPASDRAVFSVGLDHFFGDPARPLAFALVRKKDHSVFRSARGEPHPAYWFESLDFPAVDRRMNSYFVEFAEVPTDRVKSGTTIRAAEMIYILAGRLSCSTVNDAPHTLATGDSRVLSIRRRPTHTAGRGATTVRPSLLSRPDRDLRRVGFHLGTTTCVTDVAPGRDTAWTKTSPRTEHRKNTGQDKTSDDRAGLRPAAHSADGHPAVRFGSGSAFVRVCSAKSAADLRRLAIRGGIEPLITEPACRLVVTPLGACGSSAAVVKPVHLLETAEPFSTAFST